MDINLHSFILVIGLIVILFIVVDGIKKVRDARSNQFLNEVSDNDIITSEILEEPHDEASFQEYEITDDLVSRSFVTELSDSAINVHDKHDRYNEEQSELETGDFEDNSFIQNEKSTDVISDPLEELESEDSMTNADDSELSIQETSQIHETSQIQEASKIQEPVILGELESFSASHDFAEDAVAPQIVKKPLDPTVQPRKVNFNQPSKAEVETLKRKLEHVKNEQETKIEAPLTELTTAVPVLMEPVELGREVDPNPPLQQELHLPEFVTQALKEEAIIAEKIEPDFDSFSIDDVDEFNDDQILTDSEVQAKNEKIVMPVGEKLSERAAAQEIFVINVLKEDGPLLKGAELHHIFKVCDMRHGEMDIFHRFEESNGQGKIQFSVVDALKPGTFDLSTIDKMETKGISMFMSLPGPEDAMGAFDAMAEVALVFARNFGASLYDESHSDLTPQTLEHYRNRIREYSRKHFSRK